MVHLVTISIYCLEIDSADWHMLLYSMCICMKIDCCGYRDWNIFQDLCLHTEIPHFSVNEAVESICRKKLNTTQTFICVFCID